MCMIAIWIALCIGTTYDVSLDKTKVSYYGQNEELSQIDAQKPGAYSQFKTVIIGSGIIGLGDLCLSGFSKMTSITISKTCRYFGRDAVASCTSLSVISLPEGFEELGLGSFFSCTSLVTISFPSTLKNIESSARTFQFCNRLKKFIFPNNNNIFSTLDDGKILVGNQTTMLGVAGAFSKIIIPAQITNISNDAFSGRELITSITFENGSRLKYIGSAAFRYTSISSMIIPEGTEMLMNNLWEYVTSFTEVSLPSTLIYVHPDIFSGADIISIVNCAPCAGIIIDSDKIIYNQDKTVIFVPTDAELFNVTLETKKIPTQAIQTKRNLKNVTVEVNHTTYYAINNLLYLTKTKALYACPGGIDTAIIEPNCTAISSYAFKSTIVVNVTFLGNKVSTIGKQAFYKAYNLTYINLPDGIETIDNVGFHSTGFVNQTVVLPYTLTTLGTEVFRGCSARVINMSKCYKLKEIKEESFRTARLLESVILPSNLATLGVNSFLSCASLKSITLPASVAIIPLNAFQSCIRLQIVKFASVSKCHTIKAAAFKNCDIRQIQLPDSITLIETEAFNGNKNLETLGFSIKSQLKEIRANIMQDCTAMKEITFGPRLTKFAPAALAFSPSLISLKVPESNPYFMAIDNILYSKNTSQLVACPGGLKHVTIKGYVEMFCDSAFYGCSLLESIEFGDVHLKVISSSAFYGCTSLKSVEIPASVETLKENAFNSCSKLLNVTFNNGSKLLSLGSSAFSGCKMLEKVVFEGKADLKEILPSAFANCENLYSFTFPPSVETIGSSAFFKCYSLSSANFNASASLVSIGNSAFEGCSSIQYIILPRSVKNIGDSAFKECTSLIHVNIIGTG